MSKRKKRKSPSSGSHESLERKRAEKALRARRRKQKSVIRAVAVAAVIVVAGGGALFAYNQAANQRESHARDLSAIGTGVPAVVQVHDVTCPVCTELRANVERIEDDFSDADLLIRVADIRVDEGLAFARRYTTARRATLLFIDGDGELVDVQSGMQSAADLRRAFEQHATRY